MQMSLLPHIDAMQPVTLQLITNLFSEYWAFNRIATFTKYDVPMTAAIPTIPECLRGLQAHSSIPPAGLNSW